MLRSQGSEGQISMEAVGDGHNEARLVKTSRRDIRDERTEARRLEGENNVTFKE